MRALREELQGAALKRRGRKPGHAGRAALEERWANMSPTARKFAILRHTHDIADHLEQAAVDWEPNAFATALVWLDLLPDLLATRPFVKARLDFARDILGILDAEWSVDLA
eukprot:1586190-Pleurochrysis_carterae.AAC.1